MTGRVRFSGCTAAPTSSRALCGKWRTSWPGTESLAPLMRNLLDVVKSAYPAKSDRGGWARKAGAGLARKPEDEQVDILRQAFLPD